MVAGSNGDVFHPCLLGNAHPFPGIKGMWIKGIRHSLVLVVRNLFLVHDPLPISKQAVNAPMNEHPELSILEVFSVLEIGSGWLVIGLGKTNAHIETGKAEKSNPSHVGGLPQGRKISISPHPSLVKFKFP